MLQIEGANLIAASSYLGACVKSWRLHQQLIEKGLSPPLAIDDATKVHCLKSIERIRDSAKVLWMVATGAAGQRAFEACLDKLAVPQCRLTSLDLESLTLHMDRLLHVFSDELRAQLVFVMSLRNAAYYEERAHFGEAVEEAFPSTAYDIGEAAKCRALGRWTACVMHVMRILETGLGALAAHFGLEAESNWNTVLNQIEAKAREVAKKTHGKEAEQWAAEAGTHLRFIKNAWRNHAMHPLEKYDEERAIAIFDNARSFMRHLALSLAT